MKKVVEREYCNRYGLLVTNEVKENHINLLYYPNDKKQCIIMHGLTISIDL